MSLNNGVVRKLQNVTSKEVKYLNKNFRDFKADLITFTKQYYPSTWTDFNESNPGMIMLELAAYVGDVLSFYIDNQFKENLLAYAEEEKNIINIAQAFGYKPKTIIPAVTEVLISQIVPAKGPDDGFVPDSTYMLRIDRNSTFSTTGENIVSFRSLEFVDFADSTNRSIQPYQISDDTLQITTYLITKTVKVMAGQLRTQSFSFGDPSKFSTIVLGDNNVNSVSKVLDSEGNLWYEVEYLAQDTIIDDKEVVYTNSESESTNPSYTIKFRTVPRRFVTRLNNEKQLQILFGSGQGNISEDIVSLDARQVANEDYTTNLASVSLDNTDFLNTDSFGLSPANTTLTIEYSVGGGIETNVASGTITEVGVLNIVNDTTEFNSDELALFNDIKSTVSVFNAMPATGGLDGETVEEIRQRALSFLNAQNRVVTREDYESRVLAMPAKFGAVAKVFAVSDNQQNKIQALPPNINLQDQDLDTNRVYVEDNPKPNAINLYMLGYNQSGKLTTLNSLVKKNVQSYLSKYRMLTDQVNILDSFIVNIGVSFDITVYKGYNLQDVLAICLDEIRAYFNVRKWQINQPIKLSDLRVLVVAQEGVQSVNNLEITNKYFFKDGRDYQNYRYDIAEAIVDDVLYPSLDPCIFEIRYPETDIVGTARQ
jgi:hypothetical protein